MFAMSEQEAWKLSIETAESFEYPLEDSWNSLKNCAKGCQVRLKDKETVTKTQIGEFGSKVKGQERKSIASEQQLIAPTDPSTPFVLPPFHSQDVLPPPQIQGILSQ